MGTPGEPAALDAGEMFAHAVDLADIGAAAKQRPGRRLLVRERDAGDRRDPIGGRAAGKQHQDEIVRPRRVGKFEHAFGAVEAGLVGDRVSGLDHGYALRRPAIAVTGHGNPVEPALRNACEIMPFGRFGKRAGALAGGQNDEPPARRGFRQVRRQTVRGMRGADRGAEQGFEQFPRLRRHRSSRRRTMETNRSRRYLLLT